MTGVDSGKGDISEGSTLSGERVAGSDIIQLATTAIRISALAILSKVAITPCPPCIWQPLERV
jgi:hypothetical protein